eukprot:TRINITY_DN19218_c1_g1_i1.p1 TRINITY_DN19218_c1_g1~~TRINITY_DN19218_c1_g1_i1.p1  ORF type:complete len:321 (+),score=72.71 TRINITY_DN19218_c1_g1_i1:250-1212(+)
MNDLLGTGSRYERFNGANAAGAGGDDDEFTRAMASSTDARLHTFFGEVSEIKSRMTSVRQKLNELKQVNEDSKRITKAAAMKVCREKMDAIIAEITRLARDLKQKVEALDRANVENRKVPGCQEFSPTDRTRMSITGTLKKQLKGMMGDFQDLRQQLQDEYREIIERRYFTVTGEQADEETIERLAETGESVIFKAAVAQQGRGQILDTFAEIQERHSAIKDVEKQLLELQQIFLDMATLVDAQGELLDNIEVQVHQAVDHIGNANKQLVKAKSLQRSKRKWACIAIVLVLIVLAILLGILIPIIKNATKATTDVITPPK